MAETHSKISKAKARLILDHPFFATLLLRTPVKVTDIVPLAATDGSHIYYNPEFLDKCTVEDVMCVLAHEVGHDSLLHSIRLGARNAEMWNKAADHAINIMLKDQGFKCPQVLQGGWLCDEQYKGWSADRIYDDLRRQDGEGKSSGKDGLHGDVLPSPSSGDPAAQARAEQKAKQRVAAAASAARLAGKLKGELARMVDDFLEPKLPWNEVLRDFMLKVVKERDNWTRRNRRFKGVYLPARGATKRMGPIVFIPDTSGSMMGDDMEKICSEMAHCAIQTKPENIRVLWTDTRVAGEQVFDINEFAFDQLKPMGGGGTDMRVGLEYAEQYDPQVVVLLTDGHTPWPDAEPPYPLIVLCTTDVDVPVGQVIRI